MHTAYRQRTYSLRSDELIDATANVEGRHKLDNARFERGSIPRAVV